MEDVTSDLNAVLADHAEVGQALSLIMTSQMLGRETISAALGELSEHLIARLVGGRRIERGNRGFDLRGSGGERIEVKSRQLSRWGEHLMFDFGRHTETADTAYCVAWDDTVEPPIVHAAFRLPVTELLERWGTPGQKAYSARTNLRKLRAAVTNGARQSSDLRDQGHRFSRLRPPGS